MKRITLLLLLLTLVFTGCPSALFTALYVLGKKDEPPRYDILSGKEEKRIAVVPRAVFANSYELQNAPQEIARHVNNILVDPSKTKNKKLKVVEQSKVEKWLDDCNNDFDTFLEVGRDKSIKADIVIGFDVVGFQIRDPRNAYLLQGKCEVQVTAVDCATGKILAKETLSIVEPPNMPLPINDPRDEPMFRQEFVEVIAQQIAALFHHHDREKLKRIDADNVSRQRLQ